MTINISHQTNQDLCFMANYLPNQYKIDNALGINHNYLKEQFEDHKAIKKSKSNFLLFFSTLSLIQ